MNLFYILTQDADAAFMDAFDEQKIETPPTPPAYTITLEQVDEQILTWLEKDWKRLRVRLYKPFS